MKFGEGWFVIECFQMGGATRLGKENDAPGFGGEVRERRGRLGQVCRNGGLASCAQKARIEQRGQSQGTDSSGGAPQKGAPRLPQLIRIKRVHGGNEFDRRGAYSQSGELDNGGIGSRLDGRTVGRR